MKVAGIRSARYFSWSDASAPARVARLRLWISSDEDEVGPEPGHHVADGVGDLGLVLPGACRQPGEAGELRGQHLRRGRGGNGDVDHGDTPGGGVPPEPAAQQQFVVAAQLRDRRRLTGAGGAGDDQATAGADLVPVQQDQAPPGCVDLPDDRGGDHDEPGVVVQALLVVGKARGGIQQPQFRVAEELRLGRAVIDELAPAFPRGQREVLPGGHHRPESSFSGSNTPNGSTGVSSGSSWYRLVSGSAPGSPGSLVTAAAAAVLPATRPEGPFPARASRLSSTRATAA